jgi:hypothetical protein
MVQRSNRNGNEKTPQRKEGFIWKRENAVCCVLCFSNSKTASRTKGRPGGAQVQGAGIMPVALIQVGPQGHFTYIYITTPVVSALKNYHAWGFLEAPTDFFKCFWIQKAVSLLKPPHGGFRIETAAAKPFQK